MTGTRRSLRGIGSLLLAIWLAGVAAGTWHPAVAAPTAAATATPAAPDLWLKLVSIDSAQFPTLKAYVTVWDKTAGQPRLGLTPADFSATIGLTPTTIADVKPLTTVTQTLQVVLLIDNSLTDDASLSVVKTAAGHFVDSLGPADQAALVTVADTTQMVTPLTGDRAQIKAALAKVPRVVTKTSLHQGMADAMRLLSGAPVPGTSRLILAITNTGDNARPTLPPDQVISQALAASVIIDTVDFTGSDVGNSLDAIARQTGGHYYLLSTASQLDAALQTILPAMQQGYEISFSAPFAGDGTAHTVSLGLASAAGSAPVQASFVAPLTTIVINGPGVADGQTVIGAVQLSTTAVVPVPPITSIEYRLDGLTLATLADSPYTFQWDSTSVNPGNHQLKVVVRDTAGNRGEAEVTVVVALPFAVTASSDREQVAVGDKLAIRAQVSSPARIDHVEFLQGDDTLLFSDATAPYEYAIDTKGQAPGIKTFKVRAVDYLGRSAETGVFHIELRPTLASSAPTYGRWGLIALNSLAILVALLIALFGSLALSARLRRRLQSIFALEIKNEGNTRNRYTLRAEAALETLGLEFRLQGAALPVQALLVSPPVLELAPGPEAAPAAAGPGAEAPAAQAGPSVSAVKETGAFKSYQKATGVSGAIAGFLGAIASVLPAGAAAPLRNTARSLRQGESLTYEIDRADARVKMVQHATSDAATSLGGASPKPATVALAPAAPVFRERPTLSEIWALTPYVEPGEKLSLQLCAKPLKSVRTQTYGVRILSRLVDVPDLAPVSEAGNITVAGLTRLQRLQPFLLAVVMLAVATGLTVLLVRIWGG